MNRQSVPKEAAAVLISILFLALGFLAIWLTSSVLKIEGDAVFVSLLLIPILVYVIFSGRLSEIRAPGGLEAKFVDVAGRSVEPASEPIEASTEEMQVVAKEGLRELQRSLHNIDESKPITLTLTLGKEGYYDRWVLLEYIKALSQYRNFKFVIILDQENGFKAYLPSWMMRQILEMDSLGDDFVKAVNDGSVPHLRRYPGVVTRTITTEQTNIEAIQEMTDQNLEALVVIDQDRQLRGVVEREQVLSKLMLALAR